MADADPYMLQQDSKLEMTTTCLPFVAPVVRATTNGKLQTTAVARSYLSTRWAEKEGMPLVERPFLEKRDTLGS